MDLSRRKFFIGVIAVGTIALGILIVLVWRALTSPSGAPRAGQESVSGTVVQFQLPQQATQPSGQQPGVGAPEGPGEAVPEHPAERLFRITDFPVVGPAPTKDGTKILFYKKDGGNLYTANPDGTARQKISSLTIVGLIDAVWSPGRDRAAVRYLDGSVIKAFLHIGTSTVAALPTDITSIVWSPDGKSLAYTRREGDSLALTISDAAAKNPRVVFRPLLPDASISWPDADHIVFATAPSGAAQGYLFSYSRSTGAFQRIAGPSFGFMAVLPPLVGKAVVSSTQEGGAGLTTKVLNIFDPARRDETTLDIATLAEKCIFAAPQELWCAVPRSLDGSAPLPDLWLSGEFSPSDRIVRIDLAKRAGEEMLNQNDLDASSLVFSKDNAYLFFINKKDGALWGLKLK